MRTRKSIVWKMVLIASLIIALCSGCSLTKDGKLLNQLKELESKQPLGFSEGYYKELEGLLASASSYKTKQKLSDAIQSRVKYDADRLIIVAGTSNAATRIDSMEFLQSISSDASLISSLKEAEQKLIANWVNNLNQRGVSTLQNMAWDSNISDFLSELNVCLSEPKLSEEQIAVLNGCKTSLIDKRDRLVLIEANSNGKVANLKWDTDISTKLSLLEKLMKASFKEETKNEVSRISNDIIAKKQKAVNDEYASISKTKIKWDTDLTVLSNRLNNILGESSDSSLEIKIDKLKNDFFAAKSAAIEQHSIDLLIASPRYSYSDLLRYPENYTGKKIRIKGEVIQYINNQEFRVATGYNYYVGYTGDVIYASIDPLGYASDARIIEGDIIDFAGTINEPLVYESIFGQSITVPNISIEWVKGF